MTEQSSNPLGSANPLLQLGLEEALGRDLYAGETFSTPADKAFTAFGSDQAYKLENGEVVPTTVRPHNFLGSYVADMSPSRTKPVTTSVGARALTRVRSSKIRARGSPVIRRTPA